MDVRVDVEVHMEFAFHLVPDQIILMTKAYNFTGSCSTRDGAPCMPNQFAVSKYAFLAFHFMCESFPSDRCHSHLMYQHHSMWPEKELSISGISYRLHTMVCSTWKSVTGWWNVLPSFVSQLYFDEYVLVYPVSYIQSWPWKMSIPKKQAYCWTCVGLI